MLTWNEHSIVTMIASLESILDMIKSGNFALQYV